MTKLPLYIDTDMGVDDILALCMLIASRKFEIKGISVVNGVATVSKGTTNLRKILTYLRVGCPIYKGFNQRQQGSSIQFPALDRSRSNSLALFSTISLPNKGSSPILSLRNMKTRIAQESAPVMLLAIGPLTNVAALIDDSNVSRNVNGLFIMGGAVYVNGIVPPRFLAEYNFRLDPEAANSVFKSSVPVTLIPLDAARCAPTKVEDAQGTLKDLLKQFYSSLKAARVSSKVGNIMRDIILNNQRDFSNFYDPVAAAILIDPTLISKRSSVPLAISTARNSMGKVFVSSSGKTNTLIQSLSSARFYRFMLKLITL